MTIKKCSIDGCNETSPYKMFSLCHLHFQESLENINKRLMLEAFPEMNGLPFKEPINKYAKFIRSLADRGDFK